jgi:hypothetical protein
MSPARQRWTLIAACFAQFMILLDVTIVNVALPSIQRELDVAPGTLVWTINADVLPLASFILVGGTLGDRYGRKRVFALGFALFTLFSAGCALSTSDHMLIAFRALQGIGSALLAPLSLIDPGRRVRAGAAGVGDRDVGDDRRLRLRSRPRPGRRADRGLRLVGDLLGERPDRARRPARDGHPRARVARPERPPARPRGSRSRLRARSSA